MVNFVKSHIKNILVVALIIYFPLFFSVAEHDTPQPLDLVTGVTIVPIIKLIEPIINLNSIFATIIIHLLNLVLALTLSVFGVYIWKKYISPYRGLRKIMIIILTGLVVFKVFEFLYFIFRVLTYDGRY